MQGDKTGRVHPVRCAIVMTIPFFFFFGILARESHICHIDFMVALCNAMM